MKSHEYKASPYQTVWEREGGAGVLHILGQFVSLSRNAVFHLLLFISLGAATIHFYVLLGDALLSPVPNITDAWCMI